MSEYDFVLFLHHLQIYMFYFLTVFATYILTLYPTISPYRDSGDLIAAAWTLGVAHPPGYPLYSLIGKIFLIIIPFGNPAYKINLVSAVMGAAALTLLVKQFKGPVKILLIALGLTIPFWRLSIVSEMYSINGFFIAIILLIVMGAGLAVEKTAGVPQEKNLRHFALAFFVAGFASGNHLTAILVLPALALALFLFLKKTGAGFSLSFKNLLWLAVFFIVGASVFLYLPIRAWGGAIVNWGDPSNIERFWRVITRADYGGLKLHPEESVFVWSISGLIEQIVFYLKLLRLRFGLIPLFFALVGAARCLGGIFFIRRKTNSLPATSAFVKTAVPDRNFQNIEEVKNQIIAIFALAGFIVSGPLFVLLANLPVAKSSSAGILEPHFVMPDIFFAVLSAFGALDFFKIARNHYRANAFYSVKKTSVLAAIVLSFIYIATVFVSKSGDYRYNFTAYDYGRNILTTTPPGAIIYDPDDTTAFTLDYFQYVIGQREDVFKAVYFRTRWGYERLKKFSKAILPPREIYSGRDLAHEIIAYNLSVGRVILSELPAKFPNGSPTRPVGILHQITAFPSSVYRQTPNPLSEVYTNIWEFYSLRGVPKEKSFIGATARLNFMQDFFDERMISYYASAMVNNGLYAAQNEKNPSKAKKFYLNALAISDDLAPAWNNLGTLAFAMNDYESAVLFFEKSHKLEPENPIGAVNVGMAYRRKGDITRAQEFFERALKNGFNPSAANEIGLIYYEKGDYEKARGFFNDIIKRSPDFAAAYYNMGLVYLHLNSPLEAERYFEIYRRMEAAQAPVRVR